MKKPELTVMLNKAVTLLEAFRSELLPPHKVFDVDQLGKLVALTEVISASHAFFWKNLRFYYNPITSLLEPIGYDAHGGCDGGWETNQMDSLLTIEAVGERTPMFIDTIFNDPVFFKAYARHLNRFTQSSYLDDVFRELGDELDSKINIIYREIPTYTLNPLPYYENQKVLKSYLNPQRALNAYTTKIDVNTKTIHLRVGNIQRFPIQIDGIEINDQYISSDTSNSTYYLMGKKFEDLINHKRVSFPLSQTLGAANLPPKMNLVYSVPGIDKKHRVKILPWDYPTFEELKDDVLRNPTDLSHIEFLIQDPHRPVLHCKPGNWTLTSSLTIPSGYVFKCGPGFSLDLKNNSLIVSYSPLEWEGNDDSPISIFSSDGTGQGLVVLNVDSRSRLSHVIFKGLTSPNVSKWSLTGAVTFYESDVLIRNSRFLDSKSEDALNIVRSNFVLENSLIQKTASDGVDIDFGRGIIKNTKFVDLGNDAIDLSGSMVHVTDIDIVNCKDKGISAGEQSTLRINSLTINQSRIGIAVKDHSTAILTDTTLSKVKFGLVVFQKKSEFGPAQAIVKGKMKWATEKKFLVESKSSVTLNNDVILGSDTNVYGLLYGTP